MKQKVEDLYEFMPKIKKADKELIEKAYLFTKNAHLGQLRKSGEPYFVHVFATARNLAELGMGPTVVVAGLLHDVIEDTLVTQEEMEKEFGKDITSLVLGVTKLGTIRYKGIERKVENLRKFFVSMADDLRVLTIKLADRLHNIETLKHVRVDKQKRIALETLEIYAPLADRLSMGRLKGRLEDAAFEYAYPKEYIEVKKMLLEKNDVHNKYLSEVTEKISEKIKIAKIKNAKIDYRQKHLYSLWKKLQKYNMDIGKVYDIMALRIRVDTITDCYHILGIIHGEWVPVPNRIKDYIAMPKNNGYQSLHTTIFTGTGGIVEIQIRTHAMHENAENGVAAHFMYKENETSKNLEWVQQLKNLNSEHHSPDNFLKNMHINFFNDRVFVFTPKGDIIDLPQDSSPIDFAYAVHTDIGNHTQAAIINGKNSALGTKLKTHDIVEIKINKNTNPSSKWLDFAKTSLARKEINSYLKENSLLSKFLSFGKN